MKGKIVVDAEDAVLDTDVLMVVSILYWLP